MIRWATILAALLLPVVVTAATTDRDYANLNVSVALFDPGIPEDRSLHRDLEVFPRVRKIEALYLPFVLRNVLANSRNWGAIRVVPDTDTAAELLVKGTIIRSDGDSLELAIHAADASGRVWVEQNFSGPANDQDIYNAIAAALNSARDQLDTRALRNAVEISSLRYAQQLAPAAFDGYLEQDGENYVLKRLPASNDPMFERINRIRGVEYVFTDAVDAKFRELSADVETVYELWREYRRQFNRFRQEESFRVQSSRSELPNDTFEGMLQRYERYKWDRQAVEEQENWAVGFENEMGPTIEAIEERVAELEGWVEVRYAEWQRILGEMFELESEQLN